MKSVLFIDGTGGFSPTRLLTKPCGGILTSLTLIPQYLAKHGWQVTVASEHPVRETVEGVLYTPTIEDPAKASDVVVFNRNIFNRQMETMFPKSKKVWWLHDIVDHRYLEDDSYLDMDAIVSLSGYCTKSYSEFFDIPESKFVQIPNGVDKSVFYPAEKHNAHLFVCASAPIKGLYPLAFTWYNIKRADPEAVLRVYCNQSLHEKTNSVQVETQLKELAVAGATILDPIPQTALADELRNARAFLMPNHYPEICSNLILQAQACGTPVVTTGIGSATEFIDNFLTGVYTRRMPHDMFWWWQDYAKKVCEVQANDRIYQDIHENAPLSPMNWDDVGGLWAKFLEGLA